MWLVGTSALRSPEWSSDPFGPDGTSDCCSVRYVLWYSGSCCASAAIITVGANFAWQRASTSRAPVLEPIAMRENFSLFAWPIGQTAGSDRIAQ